MLFRLRQAKRGTHDGQKQNTHHRYWHKPPRRQLI
jgi:hypothetical protein